MCFSSRVTLLIKTLFNNQYKGIWVLTIKKPPFGGKITYGLQPIFELHYKNHQLKTSKK